MMMMMILAVLVLQAGTSRWSIRGRGLSLFFALSRSPSGRQTAKISLSINLLSLFLSFFLSFFLSCLFTFPGLGWQRLWLLSRTMTVLSLSWALIAPPVNNNARMLFLAKFWPQCLVSCCLDPFHYNVEFWMLFPQTFWLLAHHVNEA